MMQQTRPLVILNKYRSILLAAAIVEAVTFLVSLTDSIVAGNMVSGDAFTAIGLMAPFASIATFLTAVINSGTVLTFSEYLGAFQKRRAHEFFSQGVFLSLVTGVLFVLILFILRGPIISGFHVSGEIEQYLAEYYDIIIFYYLLSPISALLDNMIVADGGEKLSATSNVIQIVGNVVLSVALARIMGVRGIAIATVACKLLFVIIICVWFLTKRNTLRLVWGVHLKDCLVIARRGVVRATTFAMTAVTTYLLNAFAAYFFDEDVLQILIVVERIIDFSTLFLGLAMAMQPLVGTLRGENNTKAARSLLRRGSIDMLIAGVIVSAVLMIFADDVVMAFGVTEESLVSRGVIAVYISSATLIFSALMVFFFITFFLLHRYKLALFTCVIKDFVFPVGMALLFAALWKAPNAVWGGISGSAVLSLIICSLVVFFRYGKDMFPYLLPKTNDENIYIYSFELNEENTLKLSETAANVLNAKRYSNRLKTLVSLYIEDMLMLIREKNNTENEKKGRSKRLLVECTLMLEENSVKLILRDTGVIFDITDQDATPDSFLQYTVANMINSLEIKTYVVTTGYNRNEFVFTE